MRLLVGDQVSGGKQAANPGRHIGDRALEGHEGGALMGAGMAAVTARVVLARAELRAMKRVNSR